MLLGRTQSLCPVCLRRLDAVYERSTEESCQYEERIFLRKHCPRHGSFSVPIWQKRRGSNLPSFAAWSRPKTPSFPKQPETGFGEGCPFDCGLCPSHGQHTCTLLLEITRRCNLACPVCFADAGNSGNDPAYDDLVSLLARGRKMAGPCSLQFSGGEPTLREDLAALIAKARELGFSLIQVNTNGLRLADDPSFAARLRASGLDSVYLQFDALTDQSLRRLRGEALRERKRAALAACLQAGLGVVLVSTVLRGVNEHELGDLLRFALSLGPNVRGLHLQPATCFGRFPADLVSAPRLTLVEVMDALVTSAPQLVSPQDFHPPGCEHELCSFSAVYRRLDDGRLERQGRERAFGGAQATALEGAEASRAHTSLHWKAVSEEVCDCKAGAALSGSDSFSRFLQRAGAKRRFTLSAMAFQDALSLDLSRLRGCCIHVLTQSGLRVPFCAHTLTACDGTRLFRGR